MSYGIIYNFLLIHFVEQESSITKIDEDGIKWKHFPRFWPFVRGIHRWPVNSPHKGQWRGALMCSLICTWINGWVDNAKACELRRHRAHYDVNLIQYRYYISPCTARFSGLQGTRFPAWANEAKRNLLRTENYMYNTLGVMYLESHFSD